jgi:hypothetical protein
MGDKLSEMKLAGLLILFSLATASAAPAPWGIAINQETRECAGYWGGDEFHGFALPDGWGAHYPEFANGSAWISTSFGNCSWGDEEACCEELGLPYVSKNIGEGFDTGLLSDCNFWGNCTCAEEGEFVNPSPGFNSNFPDQCCEGLIPMGGYDPETCEQLIGTPYLTCVACGNGICENSITENRCNCPEDCGDCQSDADCPGANERCVSSHCLPIEPPELPEPDISVPETDNLDTIILVASLVLIIFGLLLIRKSKR